MSVDTAARAFSSHPFPSPSAASAPTGSDRTATDSTAVRLLLEQHRQSRLDQIKAFTFADPNESDLDPGARLRAMSAAKLTLLEIDQALLRLDDGSYGLCLGCTEPILAERLFAVPYTRHCVPCASRA